MRRVAILLIVAAALVVWGGSAWHSWQRTPWGRSDTACGGHLPEIAVPRISFGVGSGSAYLSGTVTSASEAEDQLLPNASPPLQVRIDPATIARLRAMSTSTLSVLDRRVAKPLLVSKCD